MKRRLTDVKRGTLTLTLTFSCHAEENGNPPADSKPLPRKTEFLTILAEDEETLSLPEVGETLSEEEWETLSALGGRATALQKALECLSRGDLSRRGLYARLRQKRISDADARFGVDRALELGYLREEEQLRRLIQRLAEAGKGPRQIVARAAAAGYPAALVREVLRVVTENGEADFDETAHRLARAWADEGLPPEKIRQKLYAAGFAMPGDAD